MTLGQGNELDLLRSGKVWRDVKQRAGRSKLSVSTIDSFMLKKMRVFFTESKALFIPKPHDLVIRHMDDLYIKERMFYNV